MNADELRAWFQLVHTTLESTYLEQDEPWKQSGQSGPYERWESLRKPVADCIDRSGSFLDIGCANGYLLECVLRWTAERNIEVEPYGLDISPALLELAKVRLPGFAEHFFAGNAFDWLPPRRYDFVRTELVYVPAEFERDYLLRLLREVVVAGGKLLVANYMEGDPDPQRGLLPGSFPTRYILARLSDLGFQPLGQRDGFDPIKGRKVRIAILDQTSIL